MKYCSKCGNQVEDEAVTCPQCGCAVQSAVANSGLKTAVKVFMILATIFKAFLCLVPLAWCIPMTVVYFNKVNQGQKVGTAFKVCTLLFVNLIAGILMLCDND